MNYYILESYYFFLSYRLLCVEYIAWKVSIGFQMFNFFSHKFGFTELVNWSIICECYVS